MAILLPLLMIVASLVSLVASLVLIVCSFRTSLLWGLISLLVPFGLVAYLLVAYQGNKSSMIMALLAPVPVVVMALTLTGHPGFPVPH